MLISLDYYVQQYLGRHEKTKHGEDASLPVHISFYLQEPLVTFIFQEETMPNMGSEHEALLDPS